MDGSRDISEAAIGDSAPFDCASLDDPAEAERLRRCLARDSTALFRLPLAAATTLASLHSQAAAFFASPASAKRRCSFEARLPSVGPATVRVGWHELQVKELFRFFPCSPLPRETPHRLRRTCRESQLILHTLLTRCLGLLLGANGSSAWTGTPTSARAVRMLLGAPPNGAFDLFMYLNQAANQNIEENTAEDTSTDHTVPNSPPIPNCTAHVDRGYLHAIVASKVDGLQLFHPHRCTWETPRERWGRELTPHLHVIVLANAELARIDRRYRACVHRVARAQQPRLSISYEIRPRFADAQPRGGANRS